MASKSISLNPVQDIASKSQDGTKSGSDATKQKISTQIAEKTKMKLNIKYQAKPEEPRVKNKIKSGKGMLIHDEPVDIDTFDKPEKKSRNGNVNTIRQSKDSVITQTPINKFMKIREKNIDDKSKAIEDLIKEDDHVEHLIKDNTDLIKQEEEQIHHLEEQLHNSEIEHETLYNPSEGMFWFCLGMSILLLSIAGCMSGLTVGYEGLDEMQLEIKLKSGTVEEKRMATIVMPILQKHHTLLCTLLITNAVALESLPICLDKIVPSWLAIFLSAFGVVVIAEIIPMSICTGPAQLRIASKAAPFINCLMTVLYCMASPTGRLLDHYLGGHHKKRMVKQDLKALIELHEVDIDGKNRNEALSKEEIKMITNTIDLRSLNVKTMMIQKNLYMLSNREYICKKLIRQIASRGFSKIPIYNKKDKNHITGFLITKDLLLHEKMEDQQIQNADLKLQDPLIVYSNTNLLDLLIIFQEHNGVTALVSNQSLEVKEDLKNSDFIVDQLTHKGKIVGLVSLKDIFEQLCDKEMKDGDFHNPITLMSKEFFAQHRLKKNKNNIYRQELDIIKEPNEEDWNLSKPLLKPHD